jgi:ketosteroid isomerase-like protein
MSATDSMRSLAGLLDKAEIADVIHAYCSHFDRAEADEVVALFAPDAKVDYGPEVPPLNGLQEIGAMVSKGLATFFAATSHHVSNIVIHFDGPDAARSICYLYAWHRYQDGRPDSELWGQYHHEFRRIDGRWRISGLVLRAAGAKDFHRARMHPIGRRGAARAD